MSGSFLSNIQRALITSLGTMTISGGYNNDYISFQQEDFSKVTSYPHINVYLVPDETSLDSRSFPNMNSYRNLSHFQLQLFNRLPAESDNAQFEIDYILNDMLDDIKKRIFNNTLGGIVEGLNYVRSVRLKNGNSDDIFLSKYLVIDIDCPYTQDARVLTQVGCV